MSISKEDVTALLEELAALRSEVAQLKKASVKNENNQQVTAGVGGYSEVHVVKDLTVSNLIKPWRGESSDVAVEDFLNQVDKAAELGGWTQADQVKIISLKLEGAAAAFLRSSPSLQVPTVSYADFRQGLIDRFRSRQPDQFHYAQLQTASQQKGETVEAFADRCKHLSLKTVRKVGDPVVQAVINEEAERRLIAAFVSGLYGNVGVQVRYKMPTTFREALNHAITVSTIDRESKAGGTVFAVNTDDRTCYGCGKKGHIKRYCYQNKKPVEHEQQGASGSKAPKESSGTRTCSYCKKQGHLAVKCYARKREARDKKSPNDRSSTQAPTLNAN
jgi:hypothetical protein